MISLQEESLACCMTLPLPPLSSMHNLRYKNYFGKQSAGLVHQNLVSPCHSFSHLLAELFSLFSPLNFLTELSLFYYSISLISLIKQLFPDPRRRRPCFEFPGSTGAGPRQKRFNIFLSLEKAFPIMLN